MDAEGCHDSDVDLGVYLSHLLAREPQPGDKLRLERNKGQKLQLLPDIRCDFVNASEAAPCSERSRIAAIQTQWPRILHIVPETCGDSSQGFLERLQAESSKPPPVKLPLEFVITSKSRREIKDVTKNSWRFSNAGMKYEDEVRYQLVGREIFSAKTKHFSAEIIIAAQAYLYDDRENEGLLRHIGDAALLTQQSENVSLLVYHRVADGNSSVCTQCSYQHEITKSLVQVTEQDQDYLMNTPSERYASTVLVSHVEVWSPPQSNRGNISNLAGIVICYNAMIYNSELKLYY